MEDCKMKILVTGTAGFIGYHLANKLASLDHDVIGLDSINEYYDVNLKHARLNEAGVASKNIDYNKPVHSKKHSNYSFVRLNLEDKQNLEKLFKAHKFDLVCHLAAQAGAKYSLTNPDAYISSNILGFINMLECCRHNNIKHLVYASSSSVYGLNEKMPFSTKDNVDHPANLYAATKKSNELMAHAYSHLFNLPSTGLRFFTVYGPWGRPDMAFSIFAKAIMEGNSIDVYNNGDINRDFTYIDDVIQALARLISSDQKNDRPTGTAPYKLYNIGNSSPANLMDCISKIENLFGRTVKKNFLPMQAGDIKATWADPSELEKDLGYKPSTNIDEGLSRFVQWYKGYYSG